MPRVSGLDVIRTIRGGEPPLCDAPVIAVTAYALREHREKIAEAGADGLIPKPLIGIEQFGRDIMSFVDRNRRRVEGPSGANGAAKPGGHADDPDAPQPGAPVSSSVFNALAEAIGQDAMRDLLGKIETDLAKAEQDVAKGVAEKDNAALSGATHVLISVAGAVGAGGLQKLAQRMNAVANGRSDEDLDALGADLSMQIKVLRSFVQTRTETAAT
jgi:FOG: CheY-like receiver